MSIHSRSRSRSGDPRGSVDIGSHVPEGHEILHVHTETHGRSVADKRDEIIARLTEKVRESSELFENLELRLRDKEREVDFVKKNLQECEDELDRAMHDNDALRRRTRDASLLEDEMGYSERELRDLRMELEEKDRTIELMKEMLDEKTSNIKLLKEHYDTEMNSQGEIFNNVLDKREDEIDHLIRRVEDLQEDRDTVINRTQDLDAVHHELKQTKLDVLNLFEAISLIFNVPTPETSEQLIRELKEIKQYITDRDADLHAMAEENRDLNDAHQAALTDISRLQDQVARDKQELQNADDVQGEMNKEMDEIIAESRKQIEECVDQEERTKQELTAALREEVARGDALQDEVRGLKKELAEAHDGYIKLSERLKDAEGELREKTSNHVDPSPPPRPSPSPPPSVREKPSVDGKEATENEIRQAHEAIQLLCERLYEYGLNDCGGMDLLAVLHELNVFISDMCMGVDELKKSRNRSRRQKEEVIQAVLEDPVVMDIEWDSESEPDVDDLSEHESGNIRWAVTRVRVRSIVDRLRDKEKEVVRWRKKCETIEREISVMEDESNAMDDSQQTAGPYLGLVAELHRASDDTGLGVRLIEVLPSTAASRAGLQTGDRITTLDTTPLTCAFDLENVLSTLCPGDSISVTFIRGRKTKTTLLIVDPAHEYKRRRRRMSKQEIRSRVGAPPAPPSLSSERRRRRSSYEH